MQGFQSLAALIYYRIVQFVSLFLHVLSLMCLYTKLIGDISAAGEVFFRKKTLRTGHFGTDGLKCHVFK